MKRRIMNSFALAALLAVEFSCACAIANAQSQSETVEWTWAVRPEQPDAKLPNVLLEGDSISRNYFPEVQRQLAGKANVYLLAISMCVGDPSLPAEIQLFGKMEGVQFRIVHFNNGAHGIDYTDAQYAAGFPAFLSALRLIAPRGVFIWATTTPLKSDSGPGVPNSRIDARNAIARGFANSMTIDDQHALMLKHQDLYVDNVHFNAEGSNIMGEQAANIVLHALNEAVPAAR
jgi:hypothetical protein